MNYDHFPKIKKMIEEPMDQGVGDIIWQIDAYNYSMKKAVDEFCLTYWQEPRRPTKINKDGTFKLRDGFTIYQCILVDTPTAKAGGILRQRIATCPLAPVLGAPEI